MDGKVEFVHSQYSCIHITSVKLVFVSDKINNNSDLFRITAILCVLYLHFIIQSCKHVNKCTRQFRFLCYV